MTDPCGGKKTLKDCYMDLYQPDTPCTSTRNIMAAQVVLKSDPGHYKGDIDGIWGKDSAEALRADGRKFMDLVPGCKPPIPVYTPPSPISPPPAQPPSPEPNEPGGYEKIVYKDDTEGLTSVVLTVVAFAAGIGLGLAFKR
jgi:hypothetical protein